MRTGRGCIHPSQRLASKPPGTHAPSHTPSFTQPPSCPSPDVSPRCLRSHTPESVMELVEAAPFNLSRRFKNYHHELNH